ncbi:hypothetical protein O181_108251 [Austropuccinia psidii MF-1]|uniref:Integrase catalytic domain-containing protein n=1 Tax=Austropuccinia psidii MF-1 TaxID=1389203 RepID=A0A9Q3PPU1_9BASI|nr:hypothetical protein [Austropuccinia psidii MF-1]
MTAPSQENYLSTEQGRKSRLSYSGQCGKEMFHHIAKPVTDVRRKINLLAKRLGNMIKIQEPSRPWEIVHMNLVTGPPPRRYRSYNSFLVIVDRFSKTPILFPCHKDDIAMYTSLLICNRVVSWAGIFTNIISYRYPKFTSALLTNLHQLFGTKLSFSTAYHHKLIV